MALDFATGSLEAKWKWSSIQNPKEKWLVTYNYSQTLKPCEGRMMFSKKKKIYCLFTFSRSYWRSCLVAHWLRIRCPCTGSGCCCGNGNFHILHVQPKKKKKLLEMCSTKIKAETKKKEYITREKVSSKYKRYEEILRRRHPKMLTENSTSLGQWECKQTCFRIYDHDPHCFGAVFYKINTWMNALESLVQ